MGKVATETNEKITNPKNFKKDKQHEQNSEMKGKRVQDNNKSKPKDNLRRLKKEIVLETGELTG